METKLKEIIDYYGIKHQLKKFNEEAFELIEAIINYNNSSYGIKHYQKDVVIEELSDVAVMLKQIQLYFEIKDEEINKIMEQKIDRQLKRMEKSN